MDKTDVLGHAKAALERTTDVLSGMQARLDAAGLGHRHRLVADEALRALGRRQAELVVLYEEMLVVPENELPMHWQRFFACYDDFLEAVRDARSRLAREIE
ncbi:hypothetical protein [Marilutibacter spongiae]|uniref:Uncharacterized protein n=1 Tax=Marilutibacter spongiae TaxID=2025720 RepID=A0A7W3TN86_9GAMM|nr:hypothetical protein [Lysobacter spongiae]MBB1061466.1 hypothetical protein [Lysobacter spongiae]